MITTDKIEQIYSKHGQFISKNEADVLRNLFYQLAKIRVNKTVKLQQSTNATK